MQWAGCEAAGRSLAEGSEAVSLLGVRALGFDFNRFNQYTYL